MLFERPEAGHRAIVLDIDLQQSANPDVDELVELAKSAELEVVDVLPARRAAPHPRTFIGSGKVAELRAQVSRGHAALVLVKHELSAGQQRNLEQALDCRVMTRTELILTIFAARARSHEGQLQVELAQLKHAQTRLVRGWTHLDRQKGGIGLRGAGEKQIELDQRMLSTRIKATAKKLAEVAKRRGQNRRGRNRRGTPTVALVGYTNAGKSTLFNTLTDAAVYVEDQLFATLDPTMRKLAVPGLNDVVLADTVGFVSMLPHTLVQAFKATLEEVVYADLLLHVVDAADPHAEQHVLQVREVLAEIGAAQVPQLLVLNKIDLLSAPAVAAPGCGAVMACVPAALAAVQVSALTGAGLRSLTAKIGDALGVAAPHEAVLQPDDGSTRAWLYRSGAVLGESSLTDGSLLLTLQADEYLLAQLRNKPRVLLRRADTLPKISNGN